SSSHLDRAPSLLDNSANPKNTRPARLRGRRTGFPLLGTKHGFSRRRPCRTAGALPRVLASVGALAARSALADADRSVRPGAAVAHPGAPRLRPVSGRRRRIGGMAATDSGAQPGPRAARSRPRSPRRGPRTAAGRAAGRVVGAAGALAQRRRADARRTGAT